MYFLFTSVTMPSSVGAVVSSRNKIYANPNTGELAIEKNEIHRNRLSGFLCVNWTWRRLVHIRHQAHSLFFKYEWKKEESSLNPDHRQRFIWLQNRSKCTFESIEIWIEKKILKLNRRKINGFSNGFILAYFHWRDICDGTVFTDAICDICTIGPFSPHWCDEPFLLVAIAVLLSLCVKFPKCLRICVSGA